MIYNNLYGIKREQKLYFVITMFFVFLFNLPLLSQSNTGKEEFNNNLVSVNWLEKNLKNSDILILDVSQPQQYSSLHIPGAINVDFMSYGVKEISTEEIENKYQSWGISTDKKIVIYDRGRPMMATRIFFDLYYSGFPVNNLFILNGGLSKWQEAGKAVTNEPSAAPVKGIFKINKFNEEVRAKLPEFLTASGDRKNNKLIEALDANWHYGEFRFFHRPGHIPFSVLLPSDDFLNSDNTFKSPEEILKMVDYFGINKEQNIYSYCGGGIAASVPFFALKFILGFPDVKLFRESEMGWMLDERELPFWTYEAPYIMRESNWLKTWGGKMMRMYGIAQTSIIDVRPAEDYNNGHIPFALNIISDSFKVNIFNPETLTNILSQNGVDPALEVSVVSNGGLNENSALTFLLLEYLGYNKVSIFTDSFEKFIQAGGELVKEEINAGQTNAKLIPAKSTSISPLNLRNEILIKDTNTTNSFYPKVFIASGKTAPNKIIDGKIINLPYTDFLNNEGRPKAANEIWKILQSAGVPRYAEIICYSDNVGEAAINYFILKLMGFPDLKVFVI